MVSFLTGIQASPVKLFLTTIRASLDSDRTCGELLFTLDIEPSSTGLIHDCRLSQPRSLKRKSRS